MGVDGIKAGEQHNYTTELKSEAAQFHGAMRTDHYWTADNKNQFIRSFETAPIDFGLFSVTGAVGKDHCLDTPFTQEKDVFDIYLKAPLTEHLTFKGRIRTSHGHDSLTSQLRGGIEFSHKLTDNDSFYAQLYVAEKMNRYGKSCETAGFFTGISHKISENSSLYIEAQAYDLSDINKGSYGFNLGFKYSF